MTIVLRRKTQCPQFGGIVSDFLSPAKKGRGREASPALDVGGAAWVRGAHRGSPDWGSTAQRLWFRLPLTPLHPGPTEL